VFSRRRFLLLGAAAPALGLIGCRATPISRMPVLFVGHGSPMNAIEDNAWSRGFRAIATDLPEPRAILAISAHWFVPGSRLTSNEHPETIHDFTGFPDELFDFEYPAPGDVKLAGHVSTLLGERATLSDTWGLDHGTWTVLHHLRPKADVPVVQLSIDSKLRAADHLAIARAIAPLRDEGVLVMASGNVTHNLRFLLDELKTGRTLDTPPWARAFDAEVARAAEQHDAAALARLIDTDDGKQSHPTPDHFLPLVYAIGAATDRDRVAFPITGFDAGSLSMRAIRYG
jgi:4,5-DOPA dioxygenase extradiol